MYDLTFGLGVAVMALIGVVALIIFMFGKKWIGQARGFAALVAFFALFAAGITYGSAYMNLGDGGDDATIVPSNTYSVTCSESEAEVTVDEASNLIIWKLGYNTTSNAYANDTGAITLNFTIALSSGLAVENVACQIGSVPEVDQSGSVADIELLDENADGTSNAAWVGGIKGAAATYGTEYEDMTMYFDPASGTMFATCVLTAEATAFASHTSADEGDTHVLMMYVAGQTYTVDVILWDVFVYA